MSKHVLHILSVVNLEPGLEVTSVSRLTSPVQTLKKTEDQSERKREESGRGEDGGVYDVCM